MVDVTGASLSSAAVGKRAITSRYEYAGRLGCALCVRQCHCTSSTSRGISTQGVPAIQYELRTVYASTAPLLMNSANAQTNRPQTSHPPTRPR